MLEELQEQVNMLNRFDAKKHNDLNLKIMDEIEAIKNLEGTDDNFLAGVKLIAVDQKTQVIVRIKGGLNLSVKEAKKIKKYLQILIP